MKKSQIKKIDTQSILTPTKPKLTRTERRLKQRMANAGRALKMRIERKKYMSEPTRMLPVGQIKRSKGTKAHPRKKEKEIHIGCSGWFYWDWKDKFYPAALSTQKWFAYYMKSFNTVELNAPFYSWPTLNTVWTWLRQTNEQAFVYTIKVNELITHTKKFRGTKTLVKDFGLIADILDDHMGCLLFQLPPSYSYSPARLKAILTQLDPKRRNVVEFRHKSWWRDNVYKAFQKFNIIFCSCSAPKLPDELIETADDIYIRFHGTQKWYRHDYSKDELELWTKRITASQAKRVWIYFNNDYEGFAIKNARELELSLHSS